MSTSAPLQLVVAQSSATLQHRLLSEIQLADATAPQWFLVPTGNVVPHLRRELAWKQGQAPDLRGLSFLELAQRLTASSRRADGRRMLAPQAATWMARRFLARRRLPAGFFDKVLRVRGFRAALLRSFEELAGDGLVRSESIERLLIRNAAVLPLRVRHVLELYHGWRQTFENTHVDAAAVLEQACALLEGGAPVDLGTEPWRVLGCQDLRVLERRLLHALAATGTCRLQIWLTSDFLVQQENEAAWRRRGFVVRHVEALEENGAASPAPVVQALSAPSEEAEALEVGRRILAAVDDGTPLHRMAVMTRTTRPHALLRDSWRRLGIPCDSVPGQTLLQLRAGRALMLFLALGESGLTPRLSMDFLNLAPMRWRDWLDVEEDPVPSAWTRVAQAARLGDGLTEWQARLPRFHDELLQQAVRFSSSGEPSARVQRLADATLQLLDVGERLDALLQQVPERGRWGDFVRVVVEGVLSLFERDAETLEVERAVRRLSSLEIRGHGRASRAEFRDAVRQGLSQSTLPLPADAHHGALTLGTEESLRGMVFDHVVLMGLREGEWPASVSEDAILADVDRQRLRDALGNEMALPSRAVQARREMLRFHDARHRGSQRVLLTYARLDPTTGATRLPSSVLMQWGQEISHGNLDYAAFEELPQVERVPLLRREVPERGPILSLEEYDSLAISALGRAPARHYVRQLGSLPRRGLTLDTLRNRRRRFTVYEGMFTDATVQRNLRSSVTSRAWSISQVNTWATCPFRFFMRRMLQLEPLDTDSGRELDALSIGRLVHEILERFHQRLRDRHIDAPQTSFEILRQELQRAGLQAFAALEARGHTGSRLLWQLRKQTLMEDLTQYLRHELQRGEWGTWWQPDSFELPFGPGEELGLQVTHGDLTLPFRGFIDRLDRHTQHSGRLVIDYKSGRKIHPQRFPAASQLVVYLLAATSGDDAILDLSEARFVYVTRRGEFAVQRMLGSAVRRRRGDFDALVGAVATAVARGDFHPEPGDKGAHCKFCDYRGICDSRIVQQSERKAAAGQNEAYATLPDFADLLQELPPAQSSGGSVP